MYLGNVLICGGRSRREKLWTNVAAIRSQRYLELYIFAFLKSKMRELLKGLRVIN